MKFFKILSIALICGLWFLSFNFNSSANNSLKSLPPSNLTSANLFVDKSARELYAQNCARCHGADGAGETELGRSFDVPNIADENWQKKHSDQKISRKIARGGGAMPAFSRKLSPKEINALVAYVRALKK